MFENILGQDSTVGRLREEIAAGVLPSSLLFYGPPYSGKMSAALELARILSCERGSADWNCDCRSCEGHRVLSNPDTLLLGPRYFATEIAASGDVLARVRKAPAQYLYVRAVRKLLRRFDPLLWEGSDGKRATVQPLIEETEDKLSDLLPERQLPEEPALSKIVQDINERCGKITNALTDNTPINQVRRAVYWAHTTGQGRAKVIVIESAENMLEGSRNALLKTLEEPPTGVYFILTTTRRGAIIPTILSRLRPYHFVPRSAETSRIVLSKIFREDNPGYESLRDYFLAWNDTDIEYLQRETERFLDGVLASDDNDRPEVELLTFLSGERVFRPFLEQLSAACGKILSGRDPKERHVPVERLEAFSGLIRQCAMQSEQFNQNRSLLLECLYYNMRRAG